MTDVHLPNQLRQVADKLDKDRKRESATVCRMAATRISSLETECKCLHAGFEAVREALRIYGDLTKEIT